MSEKFNETDKLSARTQIAIEYFNSAKAEIIARIRVRDTLLAAYAAAAYTATAAILSTDELGNHFLHGIPYLCFAFAILISYHHAGIGALGMHCAEDLLPIIDKEVGVMGYEHSHVFRVHHYKHTARRVIAHAMILLLPAAMALTVNIPDLVNLVESKHITLYSAAWILSMMLMLLTLLILYKSNGAHYQGLDRNVMYLRNSGSPEQDSSNTAKAA